MSAEPWLSNRLLKGLSLTLSYNLCTTCMNSRGLELGNKNGINGKNSNGTSLYLTVSFTK